MTIDPYNMSIDPNNMTIDPYNMTIDPNNMTIDPYNMTIEPNKMLIQKLFFNITGSTGTFRKNRDYKTLFREA